MHFYGGFGMAEATNQLMKTIVNLPVIFDAKTDELEQHYLRIFGASGCILTSRRRERSSEIIKKPAGAICRTRGFSIFEI